MACRHFLICKCVICKYLIELVSLRETQGYLSFKRVYLEKSGWGKGARLGQEGTPIFMPHPQSKSLLIPLILVYEFIYIRKQKHTWCLHTQELERGRWSKEMEVGPFEAGELE